MKLFVRRVSIVSLGLIPRHCARLESSGIQLVVGLFPSVRLVLEGCIAVVMDSRTLLGIVLKGKFSIGIDTAFISINGSVL